eukprot:CAMPEP_0185825392 /NCGR_PEP_ID=MMETSP1322-20130828/31021_1 /TAXON_ID=265543 /ORGANISM="Minutocellus polymorphus, Strain RCC2270" /LENGTH=96 /DNA_ID=CAMNT_0028523111 /DNA_START=713 /DNA_END=1003 /DNA_ORIENTATION=-
MVAIADAEGLLHLAVVVVVVIVVPVDVSKKSGETGEIETRDVPGVDASGTESDGANNDCVDEDGRRQLSLSSGALLSLQIILILFGILTSILTVAR